MAKMHSIGQRDAESMKSKDFENSFFDYERLELDSEFVVWMFQES